MIEITVGQTGGGFWTPPVFSAFITAATALVTGFIVSLISWRQWKTAKDKLAIDLFDRRFTAWKAISDLIETRRAEKAPPKQGLFQSRASTEAQVKLAKAVWEARFLFGRGIHEKLVVLQSSIDAAVEASERWQEKNPDANEQQVERTVQDWFEAMRVVKGNLDEIEAEIEPYMMLDKIAVSRPSKVEASARK